MNRLYTHNSRLFQAARLGLLCAVSFGAHSVLFASDLASARSAFFEADFAETQTVLDGLPDSNEKRVVAAMNACGLWVENDLADYAVSLGANPVGAAALLDLSGFLNFDYTSHPGLAQPIRVESSVLLSTQSAGQVTYQFPDDQNNFLELTNTGSSGISIPFEVNFNASTEIVFWSGDEWRGRVTPQELYDAWDYTYWPDSSLMRSFSLALEPGESLRLEHRRDSGGSLLSPSTVSFPVGLVDVSNGEFTRYHWARDPLNATLGAEPIQVGGASWDLGSAFVQSGGLIVLDAGLSQNSLNSYSAEGHLIAATFSGPSARAVNLAFYADASSPYSFSGKLYLNGAEVGQLHPWGAVLDSYGRGVLNDIEVNGWGLDFFASAGEPKPVYVVSLWLEPDDVISVRSQVYGWHNNPDALAPFFGLKLDNSAQFDLENGVGYTNFYPNFADGTQSDTLTDFFFSETAPAGLSELLDSLIGLLEGVDNTVNMVFSPEETGFAEPVRLTYPDVQLLLGWLKWLKGAQMLVGLYDFAGVDATFAGYQSYLGNPLAAWQDHVNLLTPLGNRGTQASSARSYLQASVTHYRQVEEALWSRTSSPFERFLFEMDVADVQARQDILDGVEAFESALWSDSSLADWSPAFADGQSWSLTPFFATSPLNVRATLPYFDERGFHARSAQALADSGLMRNFSLLDIDRFLADNKVLFVPPPASLAGNLLVVEEWGFYNWVYFRPDGAADFYGWGLNATESYQWDASEGILESTSGGEGGGLTWKLAFEDGLQGRFFSSYGTNFYPSGRFLLYDGHLDLDSNGRADFIDLANLLAPSFPSGLRVALASDLDADGRNLEAELMAGTDPSSLDTLPIPHIQTLVPTLVDPTQAFRLSLPTQAGRYYQIEYTENLADANWLPLGNLIAGDGTTQVFEDDSVQPTRFYRVRIAP